MSLEDIETAIIGVRKFLVEGLVEAFDGVEIFEPQVGWATVVDAWKIVQSNDHLLDDHQRPIIEKAFSDLQNDLNDIVNIMRSAATSKEDQNADTPLREKTIRDLEVSLAAVRSRFGENARRFQETLNAQEPTTVINNHGDTIMGNNFSHISHSVITNHSMVEKVVNKFQGSSDKGLASFIKELSGLVEGSGEKEAGELLDQFNEELARDEPRKSLLRRTWDGLVDVLPSVAKIAGATAAVSKLLD